MREILLAVKNTKMVKSKRVILDVPLLELRHGEVLSLMGHNGAGKSTLLKILALLQVPTQGNVYFKGEEVSNSNVLKFRRQMAAVLQEPLLLDTTVYKNAAVGLQLRKVDRKEVNKRVMHWLERLGVEHLAKYSVRNLSGGEAQRVSLARALVLEPQVIFLDEPFSALDTPTRESLLAELRDILYEQSMTAVFVTHDYREIPQLANRVVELSQGKILHQGTPEKVLKYKLNKVV
ncbi:MAG: ABC transporter ATP-binding protein [Firmicutes bacterium]|nr:ABC transporter ATP-binding protein [Bacillota bacterium]